MSETRGELAKEKGHQAFIRGASTCPSLAVHDNAHMYHTLVGCGYAQGRLLPKMRHRAHRFLESLLRGSV